MKTIVITGASDGIGAAAARRLSSDGHRVIVVGRSLEKASSVAVPINAPYHLADFAELDDVERLAAELLTEYPQIDVLANNAGGLFNDERAETVDGHELTFQVNYLAPWYLTWLLTDRLIASKATIINTSSVAHTSLAHFDIGDLDAERSFTPSAAYGNAKLAQLLHVHELTARYGTKGLSAVAFHPGLVGTSFASTLQTDRIGRFYRAFGSRMTSPDKGADTLVWLAEGQPGINYPTDRYYANRSVHRTSKTADDRGLASDLWRRTELILANRIRRFQPDPIRSRT